MDESKMLKPLNYSYILKKHGFLIESKLQIMTNLNEKKMKSTLKNVQKNEIHKFKITSRQNINKKIYKKYMNEVEE